ncbi:MAG: hypothetical protein PHN82_01285 [bacterium]|nr:hypothetical protein [bacterium]
MPDLVTHLCAAQVIRRLLRLRLFPLFALGAVLPDLLSRPAHILFPGTAPFVVAFHSPVVLLLCCLLASLLFARPIRRACLGYLAAGSALHLALDVMQKQICPVYYYWLFPFSRWTWDADLFWPEQALLLLPVTIAVTALVTVLTRD